MPTFLAETEEKAQELGKGFAFGGGQAAFSRPEHTLPAGYNSRDAIRRLARQPGGSWLGVSAKKLRRGALGQEQENFDEVRKKLVGAYQKAQQAYQIVVGTPKTVLPKIKTLLEVLRPGIFVAFSVQGPVSNEDRMTSMRLFAQEVMPAIRDFSKEIGLRDPLERKPGSVSLTSGVSRIPVVERGPLAALGLS